MSNSKSKIMHRKMPDKHYAWQDHSVFEYFDLVSPGAISLYCVLTTYDYGTHIVFPSRRKLARIMHINKKTVNNYLTELENAKLIKLEQRKRKGKRDRLSDYIHLLKVKQRGVVLKSHYPKVVRKSHKGGDKTTPQVVRKSNPYKKKTIRRTKKEETLLLSEKNHPSLRDVREYIQLKNIRNVNPNEFYKWYKRNDFKDINGKSLTTKNYKAKINTWDIKSQNVKQGNAKPQNRRRLSEPGESEYGETIEA